MELTPLSSLVLIIALGGLGQWLAALLRVPSILVLLAMGFLAGPTLGLVDPDALFGPLFAPLVALAVSLILFEGGLTLDLREIKGSGGVVRNLVSVGVLATWVLASLAAWGILGLRPGLAALLGAMTTVTGPTVVQPLLRHVRPRRNVAAVLQWEGIVIDPIGVLLALLVFEVVSEGAGAHEVGTGMIRTFLVGGGFGLVGAGVLVEALRLHRVPERLEGAFGVMVVLSAFAASEALQHESGLLAVTVMGVIGANQRRADLSRIHEFKEHLQVLLLSSLFIVLSARIAPRDLAALGLRAPLFVLVLVLVVRPAAVLLSTWRSKLTLKERAFIAGLAPRGIVAAVMASVFALELQRNGDAEAAVLASAMFAVIIGTVLVYGACAGPLARRLGVAELDPRGFLLVGAGPFARAFAALLVKQGARCLLVDTNRENVGLAHNEGLEAVHGNILAEDPETWLDLTGIGRLVALTSNDEVNVLAVRQYARLFGSRALYQLPVSPARARGRARDPRLGGRPLFATELDASEIERRMLAGDVVHATRLTETFGKDELLAARKGRVAPLALVAPDGRLELVEAGQAPELGPGQIVLSLSAPAEG